MSRRRILFLAEGATMAHFVRPLALADSLDPSQYDIHFHAPSRFLPYLRDKPFIVGDLKSMPGERFLANIGRGAPRLRWIFVPCTPTATGYFTPTSRSSCRLTTVPTTTITSASANGHRRRRRRIGGSAWWPMRIPKCWFPWAVPERCEFCRRS